MHTGFRIRIGGRSTTLATLGVALAACAGLEQGDAMRAQETYTPQYTAGGALVRPEGWREWVYVGTPVTPNALNGGEAPFPEFHIVYIDPESWEHWMRTGEFRDGTVLAKELTLVLSDGANEDGSTDQVSGRGYFMSVYQGLEITIKDTERFADEPGGWAYFSFGHQPEPYTETAEAFPADVCNSCHEANAAEDWVFTQFYPVLRAAKPN